MRILLIEDDAILGRALKEAFESHAYGVDWFSNGEDALSSIQALSYELMILDLGLPTVGGIDVLRTIRKKGNNIPVLILSAQNNVRSRVDGLDNGGDDYLTKPFDLDELLARVRALVRRKNGTADSVLRSANIELDVSAMTVRRDGELEAITAKEFRVLKILMERAGRYVTKRDLEYILYSADSSVESNTTEVLVYNLRKKLGSKLIKSSRGIGYMIGRDG